MMDLPTPTMKSAQLLKQEFIDSRSISPLELLHPKGVVERLTIIGSNCPRRLLPQSQIINGEAVDLIIFAPSVDECRMEGWLEKSIQSIFRFLTKDGILYVLASPSWRTKIKRLLQRQGLIIEPDIAHFPSWEASRFLVPLKLILINYAFNQLMPTRLWKKKIILFLLQTPGIIRLVGNFHAWIGFAARRIEGPRLFDWLYQENGTGFSNWDTIIHTSWRKERGSIAVLRFSNHAIPDQVLKLAWSKEAALSKANEAQLIPRFGPRARTAGARVPEILSIYQLRDRKIYSQTVIPGRLAAVLLIEKPGKIYEIIRRIVTWLEAWHRMTKSSQGLNRDWFEHELLIPVASLAPLLVGENSYLDWLSDRCDQIDIAVPLFSAHNDLSMWNILFDKKGELGVVDWNSAREKCFPFIDLLYAMTDAAMIASGQKERVKAFQECFTPGGRYSTFVKRTLIDLQTRLEIPKVLLELSFHLCFIGHACNEQNWGEPGEPIQFLEIVRYLSRNRNELREWISS
jgi:hypothetical protein